MHNVGFKPLNMPVKTRRVPRRASYSTVLGMAAFVTLLVGISIGLVVVRNIGG